MHYHPEIRNELNRMILNDIRTGVNLIRHHQKKNIPLHQFYRVLEAREYGVERYLSNQQVLKTNPAFLDKEISWFVQTALD